MEGFILGGKRPVQNILQNGTGGCETGTEVPLAPAELKALAVTFENGKLR